MKARDKDGGWSYFVWKEENSRYLSSRYKTVSDFRVGVTGEWIGYFHVQHDGEGYVRCDIVGKASKEGFGSTNEFAIRYRSFECYSLKKNEKGGFLPDRGTALPFEVACERNFNPEKNQLTVKFSFE